MAQMKVTTLLEEYQKWVNAEAIQFLQESKQQEEVSECINKLIPIMEALEKGNGEKKEKQKGGEYNWHAAHKKGRELWEILAKYALRDIEPTSKGNSKLYNFLSAATAFEDILYGLESYYRDHTLHSLWVYLIGEYILREKLKDTGIREKLEWYLFNDIKEDEAKCSYPGVLVKYSDIKANIITKVVTRYRDAIWCIMALCHDLGYSLEKLSTLNDKVTAVLKFFDISDLERTGYSLDIEHQYLVSQCLELMAMDVRIVPDEDLSEVEKMDKDPQNETKNRLDGIDYRKLEKELEKVIQERTILDTTELIKATLQLDDTLDEDKKTLKDVRELDKKTLIKCYRDDSTYWRLCRALEKKQHGILSSYLIFKILGIFADATVRGPAEEWGLDDDEVVENIIRGDILFAIAQHEFDFAHIFEFNSLADVLILADELEEFSRFGRPLQSREYYPTMADAKVDLTPDPNNEDIMLNITYDVKKDHNLILFFIRKAERLCRIYSLNERGEKRRNYGIKQIIMKAKSKSDDNKQGSRKPTFELTIKLNRKATENEVCFQAYESGSPKGDISNCEIILYDDKICYVPSDGEKEESEGESKEKTLIDWFKELKKKLQGEAETIWSNWIKEYEESLKKSEGEE